MRRVLLGKVVRSRLLCRLLNHNKNKIMEKIFMVEDDPLMDRMYGRAFRSTGYELQMASDGDEASAKLAAMDTPPAIILLDVMMPKKNGFEILEEIKQNAKLKDTPVVMLTNLAGQPDMIKAMNLGATAYLVKTQYDPKELLAKIIEIIKQKK